MKAKFSNFKSILILYIPLGRKQRGIELGLVQTRNLTSTTVQTSHCRAYCYEGPTIS